MSTTQDQAPEWSAEDWQVVKASTDQVRRTIARYDWTLPSPLDHLACTNMLFHHKDHIGIHKIDQKRIDPYKIACWYGCSLLDEIAYKEGPDGKVASGIDLLGCGKSKFEIVARSVIITLSAFLTKEQPGGVNLPTQTKKLLYQLLKEEKIGDSDHGIWKNGLYVAYHSAIATLRCVSEPTESVSKN